MIGRRALVVAVSLAAWTTPGAAKPLPVGTTPDLVKHGVGVGGAACPEDASQLVIVIHLEKEKTTYKYIATQTRWGLVESRASAASSEASPPRAPATPGI